ncbi:MAG TPA: hypothetical protein PKV67_14060 [Hyphomonas sp.]|nr:hypothetical protein [Hyphomonas sp.]HRJ01874.1 hypothetical protein [Hyphomonas sp.]HRK68739.1 hypothetical protein [Hyphomonas sp.]
MRMILLSGVSALVLAACGESRPGDTSVPPVAAPEAAEATGSQSLELLWTASGFEQPEGAELAPGGGYFISNIGAGEAEALDGNGYITRLNADGTIASAKFAAGLHGPAGLVVHEGVLYAADRDGVAMIDAATGEVKGKVPVEGAQFLNDMTVFGGDVLVSDSGTATIHRITPEGAQVFASSEGWAGINGILGDGDRLLVSTMTEGKLIEMRSTDSERLIATGMVDADGIGLVPGGGYLVSSWPGQIHHVSEDGVVTTLVDTKEQGILQNDLSVFGAIVIVPNWEPGTVTAWKIVAD